MLYRLILFFSYTLGAAVWSTASLAGDPVSDDAVVVSIPFSQEYDTDGKRPLDIILDDIRRRFGWSFIFDSRVLEGKSVKPIDDLDELKTTLTERLEETGLQLTKISSNTFVITAFTDVEIIEEKILRDPSKPFHDVIIVTSSSAASSATTVSGKIFKIDERDLNYFNTASPDRTIFDLPQTLASITPSNTVLFGALAGVSLFDLRGLGANRSMVLVNGHPATAVFGTSTADFGVDLNRFATPFLERVEVVTTPASARYGSGATVGAVNFVLRSGLTDAEAGAHYGISEIGDREQLSLHVVGGKNFLQDNANITAGIYLAQSSGLIGDDRPITSELFGFGLNGVQSFAPGAEFLPGFGGSGFTEKGRIQGVVLDDGSFAPFPNGGSFVPNLDGTISPFIRSPDQLFNAINPASTLPELDRLMGYMSGSAYLSPSLRLYVEVNAGLNATELRLAPAPAPRSRGPDQEIGSGAAIPIDNPTLPQSVLDLVQDTFGDSVQSVILDRRYVELGPRRDKIKRYYLDLAIGAEFSRNENERYGLSYRFGRTQTDWTIRNRVNAGNLSTALQPGLCTATPDCAPIDFFSPSGISSQVQQFIRTPPITSNYIIEQHEVSVSAETSLPGILSDDISLLAGADFEFSLLKNTARSSPEITIIGTDEILAARGTVFQNDLYGNVNLPLLDSSSWVGALEVSTDFRLTQSSVYESFTNFEIGATWLPHDVIALSLFRHLGHRAPAIVELFSASTTSGFSVFDPCGNGFQEASSTVIENCLSNTPLGVGSGFIQDSKLATFTAFGNPELEPEDMSFYGMSAKVRPTEITSIIPGQLSVTATWLSYRIQNLIQFSEGGLLECYSSVGFSNVSCGVNPITGNPRIIRDPVTRQLTALESSARNFGAKNWRGLDIEAHYVLKPEMSGLFDQFWINVLHTYTDRVVSVNGQGDAEQLDGLLDFPHHQSLASAGIDRGRIGLAFMFKRRGKSLSARTDRPEARIPPVSYLDTSLHFKFDNSIYFQFGVENVFDREPPIVPFILFNNTPANIYDIIGRRYSFSTRVKF